MVLRNDGKIAQVVITVVIEGMRMPHWAIVHIAGLYVLHCIIVNEMPFST